MAAGGRRRAGFAALWLGAAACALPAGAQITGSVPPTAAAGSALAPAATAQTRSAAITAERQRVADQLAALSARITLTKDGLAKLDSEIAALESDRERVRKAMIDSAEAQKTVARDVAATEARIDALAGDEGALKGSLKERRGLLAEVLAALERMGRKPPPALLVKPDDALGSVRSAILLGAVVPGIRGETEKLANDLAALAAVKREIAAEKDRYVARLAAQREEEARLSRLFAEKERLEADSREQRRAEGERVADLAANATTLQDLIVSLDRDAAEARRAEEDAERLAAAEAARREAARRALPPAVDHPLPLPPDERGPAAAPPAPAYDIASLRRDMARIEPAAAFSTMKGRLTIPVAGAVGMRFGDSDGIGRPSVGMSFRARAGDVVTAPADGQVLYAGPFRSYGELLILDAGDGYHVVLAGMSRSDVAVGQFVLAGEPVATMGARRVASTAGADLAAAEPSLYVEFRKDGKPVDPSPWWTGRPSGRTGNDT